MNYVIVNGSPRGERSATLTIARKFVEGTGAKDVREIDLTKYQIDHCRGCMTCWRTNGKCPIKDDALALWDSLILGSGDPLTIVWAFPLYTFGMPSKLKAFFDRRFSYTEASMKTLDSGAPAHPLREGLNIPRMRNILVSTCGFHTTFHNFEGLYVQFGFAVAEDNYEKIICPMAGAIGYMQNTPPLNDYYALVAEAGREFAANEAFSEETRAKLAKTLLPEEAYLNMVNKWAATLK